jgi:hypothetical protein
MEGSGKLGCAAVDSVAVTDGWSLYPVVVYLAVLNQRELLPNQRPA